MGLQGALRSGTTGIGVNAQRLAMIADNIANLNTVGYKRVDARFSTFVTAADNRAIYASGGVSARTEREVSQQGTIQPTNQSTDLAISGRGYFVVSQEVQRDSDGTFRPAGNTVFTRSGQFRVDRDGNLRNSDGYYLLSWPRNASNTDFVRSNQFSELNVVNISNQASDPIETTLLTIGANLRSNAVDGETFATSVDINTRQGEPRRLGINFQKVAGVENLWDVYVTVPESGIVDASGALVSVNSDARWAARLSFTEGGELGDFTTDPTAAGTLIAGIVAAAPQETIAGTLTLVAGALGTRVNPDATIVPPTGTDHLQLTFDYDNVLATTGDQVNLSLNFGTLAAAATNPGSGRDGVTQYFDDQNTVRFFDQNGRQFSALQSVSFSESGEVEGFFDNGESRELYQIPLVTFTNPNGLRTISGNVFVSTVQSGLPLPRIAGTGGAGIVSGSALESAAVDIAEEFSNMIITQRAFSASTKIITTADEMLQELTQVIR